MPHLPICHLASHVHTALAATALEPIALFACRRKTCCDAASRLTSGCTHCTSAGMEFPWPFEEVEDETRFMPEPDFQFAPRGLCPESPAPDTLFRCWSCHSDMFVNTPDGWRRAACSSWDFCDTHHANRREARCAVPGWHWCSRIRR